MNDLLGIAELELEIARTTKELDLLHQLKTAKVDKDKVAKELYHANIRNRKLEGSLLDAMSGLDELLASLETIEEDVKKHDKVDKLQLEGYLKRLTQLALDNREEVEEGLEKNEL